MPGKQIDREKRRGMAVEHNKHIMQKYRPQIMESILSTRCYTRYTLQEFEPGIVFEKEGSEITADVITCAAPNLRTAEKYHGQKMATRNYYTLENRIRFLRKICEKENIHTFIFGAWGCGVFGQDAKDVAFLFLKEFENADIAEIIIAIPPGENFDKFEARYMTVPEWQQL